MVTSDSFHGGLTLSLSATNDAGDTVVSINTPQNDGTDPTTAALKSVSLNIAGGACDGQSFSVDTISKQ